MRDVNSQGQAVEPEELRRAWGSSYARGDNFLFYPNEELIRFAARYVRKQTGLTTFRPVPPFGDRPRWLDLGCGIGRHVIYGHQLGCEVYGIDLSAQAIALARDWAGRAGVADPAGRLVVGSVSQLPWGEEFFEVVVSHGVLDSMPLAVAQQAVGEGARVLNKKSGLFYCDLIAAPEALEAAGIPGEAVVTAAHEAGTIQSYFNRAKIRELLDARFETLECVLVRRRNMESGAETGRFHLVLRPRP